MATLASKTIYLKENVDEGLPQPEHFEIRSGEVDLSSIVDGEIVVKALALSADPYLRGTIKSTGSTKAGAPMVGFVSGKVIASKNDKWEVGDLIGASLVFADVQVVSVQLLGATLAWKLTGVIEESEASLGIGILGMPGSTAYGGLIDVLQPKEGQTIFVSAASGAVGSLVGQIAKQVYNCTVIGSAGGPMKCDLLKTKFGYDHAIDYKTMNNEEELSAALKEAAPDGIDMYFENVGGMHFGAAFNALRVGGRIAVCGQISEYNARIPNTVNINPMKMIYSFQRIEGFMCAPWLSGAKGNFLEDMNQWMREGKLAVQETFFEGIDSWVEAFQSLFTGANVGKVVVRVN